ncbi:hypothetical protein NY547_13240 [Cnuibacter physcomitrellae]|uniref:hypothetical protein n=1 Tax=Cnuibacter physcomitrellae TaxID=1619308 RepID=UPI0021760301|nr:hypothetical protein [Cnuibacter physcomitrellae]MCS5498208.1 hypothetical protein [Cnuibacter physcomitrellae]
MIDNISPDARMWWMSDGRRQYRWVTELRRALDAELRDGWRHLDVVEIPEQIRPYLDVIREHTLTESGWDPGELATYGDVFVYATDGCYLPGGGKPGAAEYDPGADPVAIAYAVVLGYEQGLGHLTDLSQ